MAKERSDEGDGFAGIRCTAGRVRCAAGRIRCVAGRIRCVAGRIRFGTSCISEMQKVKDDGIDLPGPLI